MTGTGGISPSVPAPLLADWDAGDRLYVGYISTGTLTIEEGGTVSSSGGEIGFSADGNVTVTGANSVWTNSRYLNVGIFGTGTLTVEAGGVVSNTTGSIGTLSNGSGVVMITGAGSAWVNSDNLDVGNQGAGILTVATGAKVSNTDGSIGTSSSGTGEVIIKGEGSIWENSGDLYVGKAGTGTLTISSGGTVDAGGVIGGDVGKRSASLIRAGGKLVSVVGPVAALPENGLAIDFVVESDRTQLGEIVQRVRDGRLRTNIGTISTLDDAVAAFNPTERRPGKTIIRVRP